MTTILAILLPIVVIFIILKIMEFLEPHFPILEEKWVEKVAFLLLPIVWAILGYGIYTVLN